MTFGLSSSRRTCCRRETLMGRPAVLSLSLPLRFRSGYHPTYYLTSSRTGMCRQGLAPPTQCCCGWVGYHIGLFCLTGNSSDGPPAAFLINIPRRAKLLLPHSLSREHQHAQTLRYYSHGVQPHTCPKLLRSSRSPFSPLCQTCELRLLFFTLQSFSLIPTGRVMACRFTQQHYTPV